MALSRFFLPTKHHGHTVSELTSILTSFFSEVPLMILLYLQYLYNIITPYQVRLLCQEVRIPFIFKRKEKKKIKSRLNLKMSDISPFFYSWFDWVKYQDNNIQTKQRYNFVLAFSIVLQSYYNFILIIPTIKVCSVNQQKLLK